MPTSGTYLWSAPLAECVDDAFERCKIDPATLNIGHIASARRSINFMLVDWAAEDMQDFRIDLISDFALTESVATYTIDPDTDGRIIDVNMVALTRSGMDTTIYPMSRQEYFDIPDKLTEGKPSRYFADKQRTQIDVTLWTVPENSTDVLQMYVMRKFTDAGEGGALEPDIPYYMREAFAAGLAGKLAIKFAPDPVVNRLLEQAETSFTKANGAQRERGDFVIVPGSNHRRRTGGRIR